MEAREIQHILDTQKQFFASGKTIPLDYRKEALHRLYRALETREDEILDALKKDLGKGSQEGYMCEIGLVKSEITYMLRHMKSYAGERRVRTPLAQWVSRSFVKPVPYGTVLIMSPWNYPILLSLDPLVDALAAGNTAVIKPSAYAPATANVIEQIILNIYPKEYVTVINGGRQENSALLDCDFDYIFFTGGKTVGREVMRRAAEHLTPVTLELGGKSPCIVDETANLRLAEKRIIFGKFVNCGQTCVAPDYIYCHESVHDKLIAELKKQIVKQYGKQPLTNPDYGKIINQKHFERIIGLINKSSGEVITGGGYDETTCQIEPTILDGVTWDDAIMGEEIFGPVLPVMTYSSLEEIGEKINSMDSPLATYIFSSNRDNIEFVKTRIQFGGGCINDTLIHLATSEMGFGGVKQSGIGSYHGKKGFETFSHEKSIVDKKTWLDLPMRYQPYTKLYDKMIRMFVK